MTITDLTNTCWVWNNVIESSDNIDLFGGPTYINLNFEFINGTTSSQLAIGGEQNDSYGLNFKLLNGNWGEKCYNATLNPKGIGWNNDLWHYKCFKITGGDDVTNQALIDFLTFNAIQIPDISLNNSAWLFKPILDFSVLSNTWTPDNRLQLRGSFKVNGEQTTIVEINRGYNINTYSWSGFITGIGCSEKVYDSLVDNIENCILAWKKGGCYLEINDTSQTSPEALQDAYKFLLINAFPIDNTWDSAVFNENGITCNKYGQEVQAALGGLNNGWKITSNTSYSKYKINGNTDLQLFNSNKWDECNYSSATVSYPCNYLGLLNSFWGRGKDTPFKSINKPISVTDKTDLETLDIDPSLNEDVTTNLTHPRNSEENLIRSTLHIPSTQTKLYWSKKDNACYQEGSTSYLNKGSGIFFCATGGGGGGATSMGGDNEYSKLYKVRSEESSTENDFDFYCESTPGVGGGGGGGASTAFGFIDLKYLYYCGYKVYIKIGSRGNTSNPFTKNNYTYEIYEASDGSPTKILIYDGLNTLLSTININGGSKGNVGFKYMLYKSSAAGGGYNTFTYLGPYSLEELKPAFIAGVFNNCSYSEESKRYNITWSTKATKNFYLRGDNINSYSLQAVSSSIDSAGDPGNTVTFNVLSQNEITSFNRLNLKTEIFGISLLNITSGSKGGRCSLLGYGHSGWQTKQNGSPTINNSSFNYGKIERTTEGTIDTIATFGGTINTELPSYTQSYTNRPWLINNASFIVKHSRGSTPWWNGGGGGASLLSLPTTRTDNINNTDQLTTVGYASRGYGGGGYGGNVYKDGSTYIYAPGEDGAGGCFQILKTRSYE